MVWGHEWGSKATPLPKLETKGRDTKVSSWEGQRGRCTAAVTLFLSYFSSYFVYISPFD